MKLSKDLLNVLVCPVSKQKLVYDSESNELISPEAGLAYPIRHGIPMLIQSYARKISKNPPVDYDTLDELTEDALSLS